MRVERSKESSAKKAAVAEDLDQDVVCEVCLDGSWNRSNMIVFCEGSCGIAVHQKCYGIPVVPAGKWLCDICAQRNKQVKEQRCLMCDQTGGPLKFADAGAVVHVRCVMGHPLLGFRNLAYNQQVFVEGVFAADCMRAECDICEQAVGYVIQCSHPGCPGKFHVTCAMSKGLPVELAPIPKPLKAFCPVHEHLADTEVEQHEGERTRLGPDGKPESETRIFFGERGQGAERPDHPEKSKIWKFVDELHFAEGNLSVDDLQLLDELTMPEKLLDQELFTIPPIGTHYSEQWRMEDEEEARKTRTRCGYASAKSTPEKNTDKSPSTTRNAKGRKIAGARARRTHDLPIPRAHLACRVGTDGELSTDDCELVPSGRTFWLRFMHVAKPEKLITAGKAKREVGFEGRSFLRTEEGWLEALLLFDSDPAWTQPTEGSQAGTSSSSALQLSQPEDANTSGHDVEGKQAPDSLNTKSDDRHDSCDESSHMLCHIPSLQNGSAEAKTAEQDHEEISMDARFNGVIDSHAIAPKLSVKSWQPVEGFEDEAELQLAFLMEAYAHQVQLNSTARQNILTTMATVCNPKFDSRNLSAPLVEEQDDVQKLYADLYGRCERCGDLHCQHNEKKRARWIKQKYNETLERTTDRQHLERPKRAKEVTDESGWGANHSTTAGPKASASPTGRPASETARKRARPTSHVELPKLGPTMFTDPIAYSQHAQTSNFHAQFLQQQLSSLVDRGLAGPGVGQPHLTNFNSNVGPAAGMSGSRLSPSVSRPPFHLYGPPAMFPAQQPSTAFGPGGHRAFPMFPSPNFEMRPHSPSSLAASAQSQPQSTTYQTHPGSQEHRRTAEHMLTPQFPPHVRAQNASSQPFYSQVSNASMLPQPYGYGSITPNLQHQLNQQHMHQPRTPLWTPPQVSSAEEQKGKLKPLVDAVPVPSHLAPHLPAQQQSQLSEQQHRQLLQMQFQFHQHHQQHQTQQQIQQQQQQQQQSPQELQQLWRNHPMQQHYHLPQQHQVSPLQYADREHFQQHQQKQQMLLQQRHQQHQQFLRAQSQSQQPHEEAIVHNIAMPSQPSPGGAESRNMSAQLGFLPLPGLAPAIYSPPLDPMFRAHALANGHSSNLVAARPLDQDLSRPADQAPVRPPSQPSGPPIQNNGEDSTTVAPSGLTVAPLQNKQLLAIKDTLHGKTEQPRSTTEQLRGIEISAPLTEADLPNSKRQRRKALASDSLVVQFKILDTGAGVVML